MSPWIQAWFNSAEGHFPSFLLFIGLPLKPVLEFQCFFYVGMIYLQLYPAKFASQAHSLLHHNKSIIQLMAPYKKSFSEQLT